MGNKGTVIGINISKEKGRIKLPIEVGNFIEDFGLENDAHGGKLNRQVSLLAQESIDIMIEKGVEGLSPGKFAENITTNGIELHTLPIGTQIKIGKTLHEVTQIGKTCHSGCEISEKVGYCIMPTQGIFTKVLTGGEVMAGDVIEVVNE